MITGSYTLFLSCDADGCVATHTEIGDSAFKALSNARALEWRINTLQRTCRCPNHRKQRKPARPYRVHNRGAAGTRKE